MKRNLFAFLTPFFNSKASRLWVIFLGFTMIYFVVAKYNDFNYWEALTQILTDSQFLSIFIFPFFFFFLISNVHSLEQNISLMVRYSSKRAYWIQTWKEQLIGVSLLYLLLLVFIVIFLNFLISVDLSSYSLETIGINNVVFFFFQAIKLYFFLLLFTSYHFIFLHLLDDKIVLGLNFLFCSFLFLSSYPLTPVSSFFDLPLFVGAYLTSSLAYTQFSNYLIGCLVQFCVLLIGLVVLLFLWRRKRCYELHCTK